MKFIVKVFDEHGNFLTSREVEAEPHRYDDAMLVTYDIHPSMTIVMNDWIHDEWTRAMLAE
jgi:hypothetical protein